MFPLLLWLCFFAFCFITILFVLCRACHIFTAKCLHHPSLRLLHASQSRKYVTMAMFLTYSNLSRCRASISPGVRWPFRLFQSRGPSSYDPIWRDRPTSLSLALWSLGVAGISGVLCLFSLSTSPSSSFFSSSSSSSSSSYSLSLYSLYSSYLSSSSSFFISYISISSFSFSFFSLFSPFFSFSSFFLLQTVVIEECNLHL